MRNVWLWRKSRYFIGTEDGMPYTKPKYVQVTDSEEYREGKVK